MVIQKILQLRIVRIAMRFTSRSAVLSFASSALHPDLRILWKVSIFHLCEYHSNFSIASRQERTGRLVSSFHSILSRSFGSSISVAWIAVRTSSEYCFCLLIGGRTTILRNRSSSTAVVISPCLLRTCSE